MTITYLDKIKGKARLRANGILMAPTVREARELVILHIQRLHISHPGNAVLHTRCKGRTEHGRRNKAAEEERCQVVSVLLEKNVSSKLANKRKRSLIDGLSFFDRDAVRAKPGELLDGADQALVGALRAVSREGRL